MATLKTNAIHDDGAHDKIRVNESNWRVDLTFNASDKAGRPVGGLSTSKSTYIISH